MRSSDVHANFFRSINTLSRPRRLAVDAVNNLRLDASRIACDYYEPRPYTGRIDADDGAGLAGVRVDCFDLFKKWDHVGHVLIVSSVKLKWPQVSLARGSHIFGESVPLNKREKSLFYSINRARKGRSVTLVF